MVFRAGGLNGSNMIGRTSETSVCVYMLGGLLCVGRTAFGLHMVNFITDQGWFKESGYDTPYVSPICYRNGDNQWQGSNIDTSPRIEQIKVEEPPKRKAGIKVANVEELVQKLKNEAKVI